MDKQAKSTPAQGEGNPEADRRYRESAKAFVDGGQVQPAAQAAKPESAAVEKDLQAAERAGRSHAKK